MTLALPFPSSPQRPPVWGIRLTGRNLHNWHFAFSATYAARAFLETIFQQSTYKWVSDEEIEIHDPVQFTLTCEQPDGLDKIMSHKLTAEEATFTLPMPYPSQISQMLGRPYFAARQPAALDPAVSPPKSVKTRQRQTSAVSDEPKQRKQQDSSLISLDRLHKDPKAARNILRKANYPKPASGKWLFTPEEAEAVKKVLAS